MSEDLLALFRQTGALLDGHLCCAPVLRPIDCDAVISPALGGIIVGQEVGRSLGKRHIFAQKQAGVVVLRRGFQIAPNEKLIVAEDVVTRGGRVQETIDIVRQNSGQVVAVGVTVDRSGGAHPDFGCPFFSLIEMSVETFPPTEFRRISRTFPLLNPASGNILPH